MNKQEVYSPWFRPLRILFDEGKPPGEITAIWLGTDASDAVPFGFMSQRERLCFWPIIPSNSEMAESVFPQAIDHITLEFPRMRSHVTYFKSNGRRDHFSAGWRLHHFPASGLSLWFSLISRWSLLEQQDRRPGIKVLFPDTDKKRREAEFIKYAQSLKHILVNCTFRQT